MRAARGARARPAGGDAPQADVQRAVRECASLAVEQIDVLERVVVNRQTGAEMRRRFVQATIVKVAQQ